MIRSFSIALLLFTGLALLTPMPARALDLTVPSDMFDLTVTNNGADPDMYYYLDLTGWNFASNFRRSYLLTLDADGNILYFRKPAGIEINSSFFPLDEANKMMYSVGSLIDPHSVMFMDMTYAVTDSIHRYYNGDESIVMDAHELMVMEDGSKWTLWKNHMTYDMSQEFPEGDPEATLGGHVIEHWDPDGNVLWQWDSFDHLDSLPPSARIDTTGLSASFLEQLHVNAFDFFPNGDLLVSTRTLSIYYRIDRDTGEVIWRLGGGPLNDFTFINDTGEDVPLDFNVPHDCRVLDNGHITVFDNGAYHGTPRTYGREYVLDEDNMTATLVWVYEPDPQFMSLITGNHRVMENGHRMFGWGGIGNQLIGTEIDEDKNVVWELAAGFDEISDNWPFAYRVLKSDMLGEAAVPYLSEVVTDTTVELVCNWFGHEDEVGGYEVFWGDSPSPSHLGNTYTGMYEIENPDYEATYYGRIRALDHDDNVISDYSEEMVLNMTLDAPEVPFDAPVPNEFTLLPAYPNPFNASTRIAVALNRPGEVNVVLYDVLGRKVREVYSGNLNPGMHGFMVDGANLASGTYLVRASHETGTVATQKLTLVK